LRRGDFGFKWRVVPGRQRVLPNWGDHRLSEGVVDGEKRPGRARRCASERGAEVSVFTSERSGRKTKSERSREGE